MTHHETPVDEKIRQEHEEAGVTHPEAEDDVPETAEEATTEETEEPAEEPETEGKE